MKNIEWERVGQPAQYHVEARSYIGGREEQQDFAYVHLTQESAFAVLCDGMGGATDGAVASATAVAVMRECYHAALARCDQPDIPKLLLESMRLADQQVLCTMEHGTGGTTMVAVCLMDGYLHWLSVGDSRLYISRPPEFIQATRDHNYSLRLDEMLERKDISEQLYRQERSKGDALISYIGMGGVSLFDLTRQGMPLRAKDRILLSTDGLFRIVTKDALQKHITADLPLVEKADRLMALVTEYKDQAILDNTTFIMIEVQ